MSKEPKFKVGDKVQHVKYTHINGIVEHSLNHGWYSVKWFGIETTYRTHEKESSLVAV